MFKIRSRCLTGVFFQVFFFAAAGGVSGQVVALDDTDVAAAATSDSKDTFEGRVQPFLKTYCIKCHGDRQQKGERRFDRLTGVLSDTNAVVDYQDILDQLNLSQMPPDDATQPSDTERQSAVRWLTDAIRLYHDSHRETSERAVLRRLNSREYLNTVRDLLHVNTSMFDPTQTFPRDQTTEQLDNVGATLVTSGHLLAQYLDAADLVVRKAMLPVAKPAVQTWTFTDNFRQQPEIDQVHGRTNGFSRITLYDVIGADKHEGAYGPILAFRNGVPFDGWYEIRLRAEAVNRLHPYDAEFLGTDPTEPLRLGIVAGHNQAGPLHKPQPIEPQLAEFDLADESAWYTARVWLDQGYTPRFTFVNGLMDVRNLWSRIQRKYPDQFPKPKDPGIVEARFNAIKFGKLPQIQIHEVEIKGPFFDAWPTAGQRAILGDDWESVIDSGQLSDLQIRRHLTSFASRAYRRPVSEDEIDSILRVVVVRRESGRTPLEAYADGLKTILCSPHFLYLEPAANTSLSGTALASRLSYFLWSSAPDEQLMTVAATGKLSQPDVLRTQVDRMLNDPRSDAFITGFLDSWLVLRDLGSTPPDRDRFTSFYHYDLDRAMRQETFLFTRHLLDENLSIANFLESDFTFANKPLARLYGIEAPAGRGFQKVALADRRRGGLLGQASILTVTANGIDTSPVVRGVWLLENILGTPPSPPPPDVEPLDPDIRGAKTIRDQLEKHRSTASCFDCHRTIDPMGFALENYDPIGGWRETYSGRVAIDASGELPGGQKYTSIEQFKQILMTRQDQFARALAGRLLAYSIGRHSTPSDRPGIDRILAELNTCGGGFRDLIALVATSDAFTSP